MASITSLGTGSGIDLEGLLTQLLAAESQPVESRLTRNEANTQASISAFGAFRSALEEFQTATTILKDAGAFQNRSANSSNEEIFTASATNSAAISSYDVKVIDLATNQKLASADFTSAGELIGSGTLTITVGISAFSVDITAGVNDTIGGIKDAINSATGNNNILSATLLTVDNGLGDGGTVTKLVLTANETGALNQISVSVTDDDGLNADAAGLSQLDTAYLTEIQPGQDAEITVDGFTAISATNIFDSVIEGVTITAVSESSDPINDPPESLNISLDTAAITNNVTAFVDAYNSLVDTLTELTSFDVDNSVSAALNGDFTVRSFESTIRRILISEVNGVSPSLKSLVNIGISTDESGKLELDEAVLSTAVEDGLVDVTALFSSEFGVASKVDSLLDSYLRSGGLIQNREDGLNEELEEIEDERESLSLRLDTLEQRFRNQFAALDAFVASLNAQGDFLLQQLQNTSNIINRNSRDDN